MADRTGDRKSRTRGRAPLLGISVVLLGFVLAGCGEEARDPPRESASETAAGTEGNPSARLATAEFTVEGMTCGGCALATELAVRGLEGVVSVDAEYEESTGEGRCTVDYDPAVTDADRIAAAIREAGFTPTLTSGSSGS